MNQNCFLGTLRQRNVFVKDEGYLLKTDIFFSIKNGEINDLRLNPTDEGLSILRKDLDEVNWEDRSLDEVDNDNDDDRDDRDDDYDKHDNDDNIKVNNDRIDNPRKTIHNLASKEN